MASRSKKQAAPEERRSARIGIALGVAYSIEFEHPNLKGHAAIGLTPEKVMISARSLIASKFPSNLYDIEIIELTPERFAKVGIHFDPEGSA